MIDLEKMAKEHEKLFPNATLEHDNFLLKIANAELRDQLDILKKTLKKDSTNGKE